MLIVIIVIVVIAAIVACCSMTPSAQHRVRFHASNFFQHLVELLRYPRLELVEILKKFTKSGQSVLFNGFLRRFSQSRRRRSMQMRARFERSIPSMASTVTVGNTRLIYVIKLMRRHESRSILHGVGGGRRGK